MNIQEFINYISSDTEPQLQKLVLSAPQLFAEVSALSNNSFEDLLNSLPEKIPDPEILEIVTKLLKTMRC